MSYSFTTQGSTPPIVGGFGQTTPSTLGTTPAAKALNNAGNSQSSQNSLTPGQFGQTAYKPPVVPAAPTNAAVKSHTVSSDGSVTQTYHPPTPGILNPAPQTNASATPQANTSQQTTFPGLVSSLSQNATTGSPVAGTAATGLISNANSNPLEQGGAYKTYSDAVSNLEKLKSGIASQQGGIESQAIPLQFQQGREQALSRQYASQLDAAQQAVNQAQAALGYGIQEQGQQQSGLTSAGNLGNTAQGLLQSGLTSAGNLAQPSPTSQGQTTYNPLTNSFSGGSYGNNLQTVVDSIKNGSIGYTDGVNSLASLSPTAKADVLAALGQGFDTVASDAKASAKGSNIQVGGTAGVQANQAVFQKAYGDYTTLQNAVQNVDQFGQLLVQNMGGINPSDLKYANKSIAQIRSQLSSGQQAQFDSTLAALTSKVSGLLSVGGNEIPTDISSAANKIIDGSLPVGSLTSVLNRIQQEGNILLKNQGDIVNQTYSGLSGGTPNQNSNVQSTTASPWH